MSLVSNVVFYFLTEADQGSKHSICDGISEGEAFLYALMCYLFMLAKLNVYTLAKLL